LNYLTDLLVKVYYMDKIKILITGASGFIGTNLLEKFINDGYSVLNIDINTPKNDRQVTYYMNIDITNLSKLKKSVIDFDPDYIVHLAARTDLKGETLNEYSANTIGVRNILDAANCLVNLRKIIIASSMLVCGLGYKPENIFDYHPTTVYGESKVITEQTIWGNQPNCDWAIIRPTSIWGEWFGSPYKDFFDMIIARKYFNISDKLCTKTYGYIGNTIFQIERLLFTDTLELDNKIFYLGDIPPNNIEEWANEIAGFFNYKILTIPYWMICIVARFGDMLKKYNIPFPMTTFRLNNMTTDNEIDLSNIISITPDLPYTRKQGIQRTLEWIYSNK